MGEENLYLCVSGVKKFFAVILSILYFATTSGATVHLHYCMGKLIEKNLWKEEGESCSKCGMEKSQKPGNDCCKEEQKQVKIEKEHNKTETVFHPIVPVVPVSSFSIMPVVTFSSITEENPTGNAPPIINGLALFKRNCIFRI